MNTDLSHLVPSASKPLVFFEIAKSASIAFLAFAGTLIGIIGIFTSLTTSEVTFEPLKVPAPFEELGYSSEIATTRILDEVVRINALSTSTIDTKSLDSQLPGQILTKIHSLPVPGFGSFAIKEIQEIVQGLFGVKKERISGEITYTRNKVNTTYHVRIRQMPENKILVNFSTNAEVPEVVQQIGLKIVEKMDPVVAASYYRWNNDLERSFLMLDEALRQEGDYDDNYALVDRAQIYIQKRKFDLAQIDLDRIFKNDPDFVPAIATQSLLYNATNQFVKALEMVKKAKRRWPNSWIPFNLEAEAYAGLNRGNEAEDAYIETIKRSPTWWLSYAEISAFHIKRNRPDLAELSFNKGLNKFPDNVYLLTHYADLLLSLNRKEQAFNYFSKAHRLDPNNIKIWITMLDIDEYKNDPTVIDIKKAALEKTKGKAATSEINKLRAMLKKV